MTDDAARLGLDTRGVVAAEFTGDESTPAGAIAIFELADGLLLALYPPTARKAPPDPHRATSATRIA